MNQNLSLRGVFVEGGLCTGDISASALKCCIKWQCRPRRLSTEVGPCSVSLFKLFSSEFLGTRGAGWDLRGFT